eukprot:jgi/Galph1/4343/GphlegSOOS_G3011.1
MSSDNGGNVTSFQSEKEKQEENNQKTSGKEKQGQKLSKAERIALRNQSQTERDLVSKVDYLSIEDEPTQNYGEYRLIQSQVDEKGSGRQFIPLWSLDSSQIGRDLWIRARVHTIRPKGRSCFLVLRQLQYTVQALVGESEKVSRAMVKWIAKEVVEECLVDIYGTVVAADVKSCSQNDVEVHLSKLYIVSKVKSRLPIRVEDAGRPEWEEGVHVLRDTRLDNRVLDLRVTSQQAIFRIQSAVCQLFREILLQKGFMEIHSPKIIAGASEGGAEVFKLDYFGQTACLAQSPQLYKQMAICADLEKVFEIGPVFRAENSYTHRHLCEFTGLDIEMAILEHYHEVIDVLEALFIGIFEGIRQKYAKEVQLVQQKFQIASIEYLPVGQNPRLTFPEAVKLLREQGYSIGDLEDLSTENEKALGHLVKKKYGTDFYVLTCFPAAVRPFYTMPKAEDKNYSNSFDIFLRGEEIVSGAQRIHDIDLLEEQVKAKNIPLTSIEDYINAFRYGAPPHGGAGIGLERVVMLYLGVDLLVLQFMKDATTFEEKYGFSYENYSFLFRTQPNEVSKEYSSFEVEGNIPQGLVGTYFLNGPGILHLNGDWFHPFDGHGFIRSLTFRQDGSCVYRTKFVHTESYQEETSAGQGLYRGFGQLSGGWWRNFRAKLFKVPANTCVIDWADKLLCLHEGGLPYAMNPKSLETEGKYDFKGTLIPNMPFLAHTRVDNGNGRLIASSVTPGRRTELVIYEFLQDGSLFSKVEHTFPFTSYIHDFCFSKNYYVFLTSFLHLKFLSLIGALLGLKPIISAVTMDTTKDALLILIPRPSGEEKFRTSSEPIMISLNEPLFTIHLGNAYEVDDTLHLYACSFKSFMLGHEFGYHPCKPGWYQPEENGGGAAQNLIHFEVDMKAKSLKKKQWEDNVACDFPEVHPKREGTFCRYLYTTSSIHDDLFFPFQAVIKYDLMKHTKESWQCEDSRDFIGETIFVPKQHCEKEDEGFLLAAIYHSKMEKVDFYIFDATNITKGPICCIPAPEPFPYGFHGSFTEQVYA